MNHFLQFGENNTRNEHYSAVQFQGLIFIVRKKQFRKQVFAFVIFSMTICTTFL